jgi:hypothetical protein
MSLTVVTHTNYRNLAWLEQCKSSVAAALPPGATHQIIDGSADWAKKRLEAVLSDKYVALVDDDDIIDPRSLQLCVQALEESGSGMAFTNESTANPDLSRITPVPDGPKYYDRVGKFPREAHHLRVFRSSAIDPRALAMHNEFGFGIDWFLVCGAVLNHEAIYVPIHGYTWRIHKDSETTNKRQAWTYALPRMTQRIKETWTNRQGLIPRYRIVV